MSKPYDEMYCADGSVREHYREFERWLAEQSQDTMRNKRAEADLVFRRVGITFAVYGEKDEEGSGTERLIPFDVVPRVIPAAEWRQLEAGLRQRVRALNLYIHDVYHDQQIVQGGTHPGRRDLPQLAVPARDARRRCRRATSTRTSPASTSCGRAPASTTCSRTTCASRAASRTCSRTAR